MKQLRKGSEISKPFPKIVMCFGTFDLLHLGHLHYLKQAKKQGDYLIVVLARDKTKKDQEKPTLFSEQERLELIQSLRIVDKAVLGHLKDHFKIIQEINPLVICLGYDHPISETKLKEKLARLGLKPKIIRISSYKPNQQKSSLLKELILKHNF